MPFPIQHEIVIYYHQISGPIRFHHFIFSISNITPSFHLSISITLHNSLHFHHFLIHLLKSLPVHLPPPLPHPSSQVLFPPSPSTTFYLHHFLIHFLNCLLLHAPPTTSYHDHFLMHLQSFLHLFWVFCFRDYLEMFSTNGFAAFVFSLTTNVSFTFFLFSSSLSYILYLILFRLSLSFHISLLCFFFSFFLIFKCRGLPLHVHGTSLVNALFTLTPTQPPHLLHKNFPSQFNDRS